MAKKTVLSRLHQPVHPVLSIILIGLFVISGMILVVLRSNQNSLPQQNQLRTNPPIALQPTGIPPMTPFPTALPPTTYTSSNLGISFSYIPFLPNGIGQYFYTKEIGNTVYLYWVPGTTKPFSGSDAEFLQKIAPGSKSVEVFNKDPQQSLTDAIKQKFLTGYSENDCFVASTPYGHPRIDESFQTAVINYSRQPVQTRAQLDALVAKCPKYVTFNGVSYFMMDPKHPSKLLFIKIGQDNLPSGVGGLMWDGTIKVLQ